LPKFALFPIVSGASLQIAPAQINKWKCIEIGRLLCYSQYVSGVGTAQRRDRHPAKYAIFEQSVCKNDYFAKTGSGQT
jgi:hypothetical protein